MPIKNTSTSSKEITEECDVSHLAKKADSICKQIIEINSQLTTEELNNFDDVDLSVRLDYVEGLYKHFEETSSLLEKRSVEDMSSDLRLRFMSPYFEVKAKIKRRINTNSNSPLLTHSSTLRQFSLDDITSVRKTRLPELKIPQFSGSYTEWPDFFAMFNTVVANDANISKIEKFQHLRSCLLGAALDTISSLEPTEENYDKAIYLLKNRFDNKLLNFQAHIKEIFGLQSVERGSATSLRQLSDKLNAHLRALDTICTKEQIADGFLTHVITSKLDKQSQVKWEEGLQNNVLPKSSDMAIFLERRCRMLENLESSMVTKLPNHQVSKKSNSHVKNVLVASNITSSNCTFCNAKDHYITTCTNFTNISPMMRYKEAKKLNLCLNCLRKGHGLSKCKSGNCRRCSMKHHTLLHIDNNSIVSSEISQPSCSLTQHDSQGKISKQSNSSIQTSTLVSSLLPSASENLDSATGSNVFLATAIILVKNSSGVYVPCRGIFDSASQLNFISSRLAKQLQLKVKKSFTSISGIGDGNFLADKSVNITIKSCHSDYLVSCDAVVIPTITGYRPSTRLDVNQFKIPSNIKLADPDFNKGGRIDILIGAGLFFELMSVGQIRLGNHLPILQKTQLGWVVSGGGDSPLNSVSLATIRNDINTNESEALGDILKSFWEIENNFENYLELKPHDEYCENHFQKHTVRLETGAYSVNLPKILSVDRLGDSYKLAQRRFYNLEKKLNSSPNIRKPYVDFMEEYIHLNHMSLVETLPSQVKVNFLPHHCVHKVDSTTTKLRVVFDGSAKTSSGISLNDILHTGPTIQPKLFQILFKFRFYKIALSGDICKMYRCVSVTHPDDFLQCILWRKCPDEDLNIYKLNTVTYGTKPAAFLAIRAMHQLSIDEEKSFPIGAKIVKNDFYVDDLITGGKSTEEVTKIRQQVTNLLKEGNFQIRKWCSNDSDVISEIPPQDREESLKFHDGTNITKTLGLVWDPKADNFIFSFSHIDEVQTISKRSVLSTIARFYDPLGLIGPVITKAKIFMQHLWKCQLNWDESLPQELHSTWRQFISSFSLFHKFTFPRYVSIPDSIVQIHAFCDASLSAYGASIYVRSQLDGKINVKLLCSKSRVAPLKTLTVPKLELSAALLLAELLESVVRGLNHKYEYHCWSDSIIVLSWLHHDPADYNIFVANRVSRIQNLTKNMSWHHVPTKSNPADILSRGAVPEELLNSKLWKEGPSFLHHEPKYWPQTVQFLQELPERRKVVLITSTNYDFSINCKYHNSFSKLQRIFAYVSRFLKYKKGNKYSENLTPQDIRIGTHTLIRNIQFVHFSTEYFALKTNNSISSKSKLHSLSPFISSDGLIRVGGRLQNSFLNFDARHPIILPKHHPVTASIIVHYHQKLLHAGPQCLLANIRQQYWPIGGRKTVCAITSKCIRCFRLKPKIAQHLMGNLPEDRVQPNRAFYTTGIDFCGPFFYKSEIRSRPPRKCYICIFICFSTKATHLELVQDLSTASFLLSLKRFISLRGKPSTIWSDNATNFVGAKNELDELRQIFFDQSQIKVINNQCIEDGINWKFIPPRSPHFGGLWEAAVKTAKYHFYRTVGSSILTFDELRTLVCQISSILNSRPLCPITENPDDLEVLTPAHFLVGSNPTSFAEPDLTELNTSDLNRWQRVCYMQQIFWKKWSKSYLNLLQERSKWRSAKSNLTIGTMVLVKEENTTPLKWELGRITDLVFGRDGVARIAIIKTSNSTIRRPISKLAALPI